MELFEMTRELFHLGLNLYVENIYIVHPIMILIALPLFIKDFKVMKEGNEIGALVFVTLFTLVYPLLYVLGLLYIKGIVKLLDIVKPKKD